MTYYDVWMRGQLEINNWTRGQLVINHLSKWAGGQNMTDILHTTACGYEQETYVDARMGKQEMTCKK